MADNTPKIDAKKRARGRELALLVLCHLESYKPEERDLGIEIFWSHPPGEQGDEELQRWLHQPLVAQFARHLLSLLVARWAEVDRLIEQTSRSWRLARMGRIDRNVLRLAVIELQCESTAKEIILAEAVRLASRYGSETSAPFVNGVMNEIAQNWAKNHQS